MNKEPQRVLSAWQIAISLASMHYGIGMLIGTGQEIAISGPKGMLFAVSAGIGILFLLPMVNFYWKEKFPLWDLFGAKYGLRSAYLTSFLSVFWMIGLIAGFILGGSAAFKIFGFNSLFSSLLIIVPIYILSLVKIKSLSKIFTILLALGSIFIVVVLKQNNFSQLWQTPSDFIISIRNGSHSSSFTTIINVILITVFGMDFHQFLVRAKSTTEARKGILLGSLILFGISLLIGAAVISALPNLPSGSESIQVIPVILLTTGQKLAGKFGFIFTLPILFVAIGSGSGITKIISQSIRDLLPKNKTIPPYQLNCILLLIALLFSLTKSSLVELIVSFYSMYIGAVFIPFLGYILEKKGKILIQPTYFFTSMLIGFLSSSSLFLINILLELNIANLSLYLLATGFLSSGATLMRTMKIVTKQKVFH